MPVVKTSARGQIVIPAAIREHIGLKPEGKVLITLDSHNKVIVEWVPDDPIAAACGFLQEGPSLTDVLLKERQDDRRREEAHSARLLRAARLPQERTEL